MNIGAGIHVRFSSAVVVVKLCIHQPAKLISNSLITLLDISLKVANSSTHQVCVCVYIQVNLNSAWTFLLSLLVMLPFALQLQSVVNITVNKHLTMEATLVYGCCSQGDK